MKNNETEFTDTHGQSKDATPSVSLQEIETVITIIDLCAKRGAFEASEFISVGTIRESFSKLLTYHTPEVVDDSNDIPL